MTEGFDPRPAAQMLAEAWRTGERLTALPEAIRPRTLAEGYEVQDHFVATAPGDVVGWKLGVGSAKLKRETGIGRAIAGRLLSSHIHPAGATVTMPNDAPVTVEFEIVFILGRDVSPDENIADPMTVVSEVRTAFELVLSRFVDRRAVGWPSFAADDAAFEAFIPGPSIESSSLDEVARTLVVSLDGVDRARTATGEDETVARDALDDLLVLARERRITLPKGTIVTTGTLSVPFNVTGAGRLEARFAGQSLAFILARP